jgi:hypothetical protein
MDPFKAINEKNDNKAAYAQAESIALQTLQHLATSEEELQRFSALSGIEPQDFRNLAAEPGFFVGLMDFFLNHEPSLLTLCANQGIEPQDFARAREVLNGTSNREQY